MWGSCLCKPVGDWDVGLLLISWQLPSLVVVEEVRIGRKGSCDMHWFFLSSDVNSM